jgi:hybrid cluster-associated redox disulfide protein
MVKKKTKQKITKKMTFAEVLNKYPETVNVFLKNGMTCVGCPLSRSETIEQGAKAHGVNVKKLINDLNKKIKRK